MANGDKAAARGWTTFPSTQAISQGYDNDNYVADRAAEQAARLDVVEKTIGTPKFSASVSTNGFQVPADTWTLLTAGAYRTPAKNIGFASWSDGVLKILRPGCYMVHAHTQFRDNDYGDTGVQVTRNTTVVDTTSTVASHEFSVDRPTTGSNKTQSNDATKLLQPCAAGDLLRCYVLQRNVNADTVTLGKYPQDIVFEVIWMDEL